MHMLPVQRPQYGTVTRLQISTRGARREDATQAVRPPLPTWTKPSNVLWYGLSLMLSNQACYLNPQLTAR